MALASRFDEKVHFGSYDPAKEEVSEAQALARYDTIVRGAGAFMQLRGFLVQSSESENVFRDFCRRQLGNPAYGYQLTVKAAKDKETLESNVLVSTLTARVEAFRYANGRNYGNVNISAQGDPRFTEEISRLYAQATPLNDQGIRGLIQLFWAGKQACYGECKRD